jgi:GTP-binding protein EngB required for normal cell division
MSSETRSIVVVGKTGAGKSWLLNKIIGRPIFNASSETKSCTSKIESREATVSIHDGQQNGEKNFNLTAFDTPGIGDSEGRSIQFLNEIAETIQSEPFNLLIVLVDYGRYDVGVKNYLEVLKECLNGLSQSSTMLIVNKVPTEKVLAKKRANGEQIGDRDQEIRTTLKNMSDALNMFFKYELFLEDDSYEENNEKKYDHIRQTIYSCRSHLDASQVRTWKEIVEFYSTDTSGLTEKELEDKYDELKKGIKGKLDKIEFDIADVKYPFLHLYSITKRFNAEFVRNFECAVKEEEYFRKKKVTKDWLEIAVLSVGAAVDVGFSYANIPVALVNLSWITFNFLRSEYRISQSNVEDLLNNLGRKRIELKEELDKYQRTAEENKENFKKNQEKIRLLEAALVNQHQTKN